MKPSISKKIFKSIPFTKDESTFIDGKFKILKLKKGDILLSPNHFITDQYYILDGCLRSFFVTSDGKDYTTQFAINDWWISDYISYFKEQKSIMSIECIKDATVAKISKEDLNILFNKFPDIERFIRLKLERAFAGFQQRIVEYLSLPAKERYLKFKATYPEIEACVKNYHIASYLGITTESLSRIRKSL